VSCAGGYEDGKSRLDMMLNAVEHRLSFAFLYQEN